MLAVISSTSPRGTIFQHQPRASPLLETLRPRPGTATQDLTDDHHHENQYEKPNPHYHLPGVHLKPDGGEEQRAPKKSSSYRVSISSSMTPSPCESRRGGGDRGSNGIRCPGEAKARALPSAVAARRPTRGRCCRAPRCGCGSPRQPSSEKSSRHRFCRFWRFSGHF